MIQVQVFKPRSIINNVFIKAHWDTMTVEESPKDTKIKTSSLKVQLLLINSLVIILQSSLRKLRSIIITHPITVLVLVIFGQFIITKGFK